jgi:hypothetical protein
MYGLIRHELVNVATFTLPWAVQSRSSYDTISTAMGGFLKSDLVVLTNTVNQDLADYAGPDVELVVSPVNNAVASATQLTCLQLLSPDALSRLGDSGGHIQRGISRILRARVYLDILAFCIPSPPDYMREILGTGRGAVAFLSASYESSFKVPSGCYTMAARRVLGFTTERASHVLKCLGCNEAPLESRGSIIYFRRRSREPLCRVNAPQDHIPWCPCSLYAIQLHDRIVHVLEAFVLEAGAT